MGWCKPSDNSLFSWAAAETLLCDCRENELCVWVTKLLHFTVCQLNGCFCVFCGDFDVWENHQHLPKFDVGKDHVKGNVNLLPLSPIPSWGFHLLFLAFMKGYISLFSASKNSSSDRLTSLLGKSAWVFFPLSYLVRRQEPSVVLRYGSFPSS